MGQLQPRQRKRMLRCKHMLRPQPLLRQATNGERTIQQARASAMEVQGLVMPHMEQVSRAASAAASRLGPPAGCPARGQVLPQQGKQQLLL